MVEPLRIIEVDDDPAILRVLKDYFQAEGHEVAAHTNVNSALDDMQKNKYDVLITDIVMPERDGFDLIDQLRNEGNNIPVFVITGYVDNHRSKALSAGVAGVIGKPIDLDDLEQIIYDTNRKVSTAGLADSKTISASANDENNDLILGFCDEVEEMLSQFESNVQRLKEFVYDGSAIHEDYVSFLRNKDVMQYLEAIEDYNRTVHTIKGTSLFMGLKNLNRYAHALEDITTGIPSGDVILDKSVFRIINNSTSVFGRFVDRIREEVSDENFSIQEVVDEIDEFKVNSESPILSGIRLRDVQSKDIGRIRDSIKRKPKLSFDLEIFDRLLDDYMVIMDRVNNAIEKKNGDMVDASEIMSEHLNALTNSTQTAMETARYDRIVGDLTNLQHKKVEYCVVMNEARARPDIWDHVHTALIHMHRNAVDHGIETTEERRKSGKDPCASIKLAIWDDYKNIYISLSDDGRGIDPKKIAAAALERGVVSVEQINEMSDADKQRLIFAPGFSTKTSVSDISGRGVGMDAVIHEIQTVLEGEVEVSSERGVGTKITLHFPKSNSLTECLIVGNDELRYGMHWRQEMHYVVINKGDCRTLDGSMYYYFRNEIVPVVDLFTELGHLVVESKILVIIKLDHGEYVAISVPGIVGHTQLRIYRNKVVHAPYFFGQASYQSNPLVILDIDEIIEIAQCNQDARLVVKNTADDGLDTRDGEPMGAEKTDRWGIVVEGAQKLFIILHHKNIRYHSYDEMLRSYTPDGNTIYTVDGSINPMIDLVEKLGLKCAEDKKMVFTMSNEGKGTNAYLVPNVIDQAVLDIQGLKEDGSAKLMYATYGSDIIEVIELERMSL